MQLRTLSLDQYEKERMARSMSFTLKRKFKKSNCQVSPLITLEFNDG